MKSFIYCFLFLMLYNYASGSDIVIPSEFSGESLLSAQKISISTTDEKQKGLVLIFMSTKCPCSNTHVALIKKLSDEHKDFRFLVVHSNPDESKAEAQKYFQAQGFSFDVIQDEKTQIADLLKAYKTPHAFVISPRKEILYRGGVTNSTNAAVADRQFLADALTEISNQKKVSQPEGRTLGCVIRREGEKNVF